MLNHGSSQEVKIKFGTGPVSEPQTEPRVPRPESPSYQMEQQEVMAAALGNSFHPCMAGTDAALCEKPKKHKVTKGDRDRAGGECYSLDLNAP